MKVHVLIGFLFTYIIIGKYWVVILNGTTKETNEYHFPDKTEARNSSRFQLTTMDIELFENGLWVYDDDENLVQASAEMYGEEDDEDESYEETSKDMEKRVNFMLYTADNSKDYQPLFINDKIALTKSNFDNQKATRIITHGWMNSFKSPACTLIRDGETLTIKEIKQIHKKIFNLQPTSNTEIIM